MARIYRVAADMSEKEKAVGRHFDLWPGRLDCLRARGWRRGVRWAVKFHAASARADYRTDSRCGYRGPFCFLQ